MTRSTAGVTEADIEELLHEPPVLLTGAIEDRLVRAQFLVDPGQLGDRVLLAAPQPRGLHRHRRVLGQQRPVALHLGQRAVREGVTGAADDIAGLPSRPPIGSPPERAISPRSSTTGMPPTVSCSSTGPVEVQAATTVHPWWGTRRVRATRSATPSSVPTTRTEDMQTSARRARWSTRRIR